MTLYEAMRMRKGYARQTDISWQRAARRQREEAVRGAKLAIAYFAIIPAMALARALLFS